MARFRRRATTADSGPGLDGSAGPGEAVEGAQDEGDTESGAPAGEPGAVPGTGFDRSQGPFDESEAGRSDQDLPRLDLGALLIPGLAGLSVQVEADPSSQEVRAVTAVGERGAVQLQAFAAPRSEGIWDEIRTEMLAELGETAGAKVTEGDGHFGPELRGVLPARTAEGKQTTQPVRFVGIDGPRWFLRVVFLGHAAVDPDPEDELHRLVRQTIVVRGTSAMAPRDPLTLTLPPATPEDSDVDTAGGPPQEEGADPHAADAEAKRYSDLDPFERGPEITETR